MDAFPHGFQNGITGKFLGFVVTLAMAGLAAPLEFPFDPEPERREEQNQNPNGNVIEGAQAGNESNHE